MAVRDCEKTVEIAIRSILRQSYGAWELIILDDGSTDKTVEIAKSFDDSRIQVRANGRHEGLPHRLNEAILLSTGKYFARMDGDDVAYPERFERQVRYLEEHFDADLLGAGILVFQGNGYALGTRAIRRTHEEICYRPWSGFYLPHPTWIGRTSWFRRHLYRPEAVRMEDQELMLRTYRTSRFASMPDILLGYREDSFSLRKSIRSRFHLVKVLLKRSLRDEGTFAFAWRGMVEHTLKVTLEIFAVASGRTYRILRHRALPLKPAELARWEQVWRELTISADGSIVPALEAQVRLPKYTPDKDGNGARPPAARRAFEDQ